MRGKVPSLAVSTVSAICLLAAIGLLSAAQSASALKTYQCQHPLTTGQEAFQYGAVRSGFARLLAHRASLSPGTKNGSMSLYSNVRTAEAAGPLPCAISKNDCSDCATMARARSFL